LFFDPGHLDQCASGSYFLEEEAVGLHGRHAQRIGAIVGEENWQVAVARMPKNTARAFTFMCRSYDAASVSSSDAGR